MTAPDLAESLSVVDPALRRFDRNILLSRLRQGLSNRDVRKGLESVGLPVLQELQCLYGWKNGTLTSNALLDDLHLFPGFYFLSLEDALLNYRTFISDGRWEQGWLPIFANGGGDFYLVDLASDGGPVRHFWIEESEHPVEFSSLSSMFNAIAHGFAQNIFCGPEWVFRDG